MKPVVIYHGVDTMVLEKNPQVQTHTFAPLPAAGAGLTGTGVVW
jgi:hypothetical protein